MSAPSIRVIIYTAHAESLALLRHDLLGIPGVKITAELDDTIMLVQATQRFPVDVVLVDLDPNPDEVIPVAGGLAMERPDLHIFAISESTDGQLILSAMRSGISEFLTKPLDTELLRIAIQKVAQRKETQHQEGKLISVMGSSGGVGSTTLACNLAVELADLLGEGKVALVDLDYRFGQAATMLDIQPSYTIADLVDTSEQVEQSVIERAMMKHDSGVHILARPNHFAQADMITAAHCAGILNALIRMYEYVIVDGPNRFDMGGKVVLDVTDQCLLVIQLLVTSVRNVHRIVEAMRESGYNMDRVKVICNRTGKDSGLISTEYVEETLNQKVFHTLPDEWSAVSNAINMGVPLKQEHGKSRIRLAIRELAERIHQPDKAAEKKDSAPKAAVSLWSKMLRKG